MSGTISHHLFGIAFAVLAFFVFGRGIVRKANGKDFQPLWAFLLILIAISYQFWHGSFSLMGRVSNLLVDFGLAMAIAAGYLALNRERASLFFVPGLLSIFLGGVISLFNFCIDTFTGSISPDTDTIELLVELGPDDQISEIQPILEKYGAKAERAFPNVDLQENEDLAQYYSVVVDVSRRDPLMMELENDPENVDHFDVNRPVSLIEPQKGTIEKNPIEFLANDPYLGSQWYAEKLSYNLVYEFLKEHKPVKKIKVAIVDTGVDNVHEDITGVYKKSGGAGDNDKHSHGTHCAGLAGAATNNGKGVGSLNWGGEYIALSGYPALDDQGRGTDKKVAKAIIDAAESGADVISMSLGGFSPFGAPKAQVDAIKYARKLGAIVVVAAGNSNDDAKRYSPANIEGVIVVAAVDENFGKAVFSNTNTSLKMPIAAPGVNILSSVPGNQYQSYNGTSMATPIVSGLVGIMRSFNPDLSAEDIYRILNETGTVVGDSENIGKVINPQAAILAVQ
ncbi:MAG: S8 family serine peptidase [Bacteroidia bacterium]|nr:S8 family serine peptidase [Bacteroidia bacterium]